LIIVTLFFAFTTPKLLPRVVRLSVVRLSKN